MEPLIFLGTGPLGVVSRGVEDLGTRVEAVEADWRPEVSELMEVLER